MVSEIIISRRCDDDTYVLILVVMEDGFGVGIIFLAWIALMMS